jgi:hypothetical protein
VHLNPSHDALVSIYFIADEKAYSSEKHRQVNAQFIPRPGQRFTDCRPRAPNLGLVPKIRRPSPLSFRYLDVGYPRVVARYHFLTECSTACLLWFEGGVAFDIYPAGLFCRHVAGKTAFQVTFGCIDFLVFGFE